MLERLIGIVEMTQHQMTEYTKSPDDLGEVEKGNELPLGYKRCGKCGHAKKLYLFNKNSSSKTNTSGSCKECQKSTAKKSYSKTKQKRNYKRYYQENKEVKREHARKYYEKNKDNLNAKHKEYVQSKKGKKVMAKAHAKRFKALATNKGVPYTRALVISRDGIFQGYKKPLCYLCQKEIVDTSGKGLHIDHVIPVVEGGLDCFTNVASTHAECNLKREKDARELTASQVESIKVLAGKFMDRHPEKFE